MLEAHIEELTKAVRDLIDVMHNQQGVTLQIAPQSDTAKEEIPNETPKSSPTTSASEPSSPESVPATYDDVKKLVIAISKTSRDKAGAALQRLGVSKATELKDHQWPAAVAYLAKVASGEVDPESAHE